MLVGRFQENDVQFRRRPSLLPGSDNISGFFIPSRCRVSFDLGLCGLV